MAKTNWQMGDTVMPSDLNELGREVNENAAALEEHTSAAVLDHPDNSVTDAKIGNRTISDTAAPDGDSAAPTKLWSWLAYMIKSITGKSSWRTPPATTLETVKTHMDSANESSLNNARTISMGGMF